MGYKNMPFNALHNPLPQTVALAHLLAIKPIHHLLRGRDTDPVYQSLSSGCAGFADDQGSLWY